MATREGTHVLVGEAWQGDAQGSFNGGGTNADGIFGVSLRPDATTGLDFVGDFIGAGGQGEYAVINPATGLGIFGITGITMALEKGMTDIQFAVYDKVATNSPTLGGLVNGIKKSPTIPRGSITSYVRSLGAPGIPRVLTVTMPTTVKLGEEYTAMIANITEKQFYPVPGANVVKITVGNPLAASNAAQDFLAQQTAILLNATPNRGWNAVAATLGGGAATVVITSVSADPDYNKQYNFETRIAQFFFSSYRPVVQGVLTTAAPIEGTWGAGSLMTLTQPGVDAIGTPAQVEKEYRKYLGMDGVTNVAGPYANVPPLLLGTTLYDIHDIAWSTTVPQAVGVGFRGGYENRLRLFTAQNDPGAADFSTFMDNLMALMRS